MSFRLRPWHEPDFETLWQIDQQCFLPGIAYSKRELDMFLRRSGAICIVAEEVARDGDSPPPASVSEQLNPRILGFVIMHLNVRKLVAHVITIDVQARARRMGAGTALITAAEKRALDRKCTTMQLEAAADNESALAFYARHGYAVVRELSDYYAPGAHARELAKQLQ